MPTAKAIADLRREYQHQVLDENDIKKDPFAFFAHWFHEAIKAKVDSAEAMTLATVSANNTPDARMVLLKHFDHKGAVFYTNYNSKKGKQLKANKNVALVFWWPEIERQIRILGTVKRLNSYESDAYFASRPKGAQIAAHASKQSQTVKNRAILDDLYKKMQSKLGAKTEIPRPSNWGGFLVTPHTFEFWQGRLHRFHDRIQFVRGPKNKWHIYRLAP